jgi:hypothetical protein
MRLNSHKRRGARLKIFLAKWRFVTGYATVTQSGGTHADGVAAGFMKLATKPPFDVLSEADIKRLTPAVSVMHEKAGTARACWALSCSSRGNMPTRRGFESSREHVPLFLKLCGGYYSPALPGVTSFGASSSPANQPEPPHVGQVTSFTNVPAPSQISQSPSGN